MDINDLRLVTSPTELTVGQQFYIVERGALAGPFTVQRLTGARTTEHIVASSRYALFEQYVPYAVYVEGEPA